MVWLKSLREEKKLTQRKVADNSGISLSFYNQIENNVRAPSVGVAKKIANVLNFDWSKFFEEGK